MSCGKCEEIQKLNKEGKQLVYLRVEESSVLISACDYHFNVIRSALTGKNYDESPVYRIVRDDETNSSFNITTKSLKEERND